MYLNETKITLKLRQLHLIYTEQNYKRNTFVFANQQPDQLYVKEMCCTAWGKRWSHQILTGFQTPPIQ